MYNACVGNAPGSAWCAAFVAWRVQEAAKELHMTARWPMKGYCPTIANWAKANGWVCPKPLPGHAVIYWFADAGRWAHIGIIESVSPDGKTITTIEGNTNEDGGREGYGVFRKVRRWNPKTMMVVQIV
jgi:hypothetical protein